MTKAPLLDPDDIARLDAAQKTDRAPEDPWQDG
jgi:hypothetical protein